MTVPPFLTSILDTLVVESQRLEEASDSVSPNLWTLVDRIKAVKVNLKKVEKELLRFLQENEVDKEEKEKVEDLVINEMSRAEMIIYPEDYKLDKLVFSLVEEADDEMPEKVIGFKDVVAILTDTEVETPIDGAHFEAEDTSDCEDYSLKRNNLGNVDPGTITLGFT